MRDIFNACGISESEHDRDGFAPIRIACAPGDGGLGPGLITCDPDGGDKPGI